MHLYLANKLYSSWSMRPWLVMRHIGLDFDETVIPLRQDDTKARILEVSPSGKLPCLHFDDGTVVWDSLAIISTLADRYPHAPVWPSDPVARAHAKAISCEMHSGFQALRSTYPMNFGKRFKSRDLGPDVAADVARIEALWREARGRFAGAGDFLYGDFSAADAMFAPVVNRLSAYQIPVGADTRAYMDAIEAHPLVREWRAAGLAEPWEISAYEAGHEAVEDFRAPAV